MLNFPTFAYVAYGPVVPQLPSFSSFDTPREMEALVRWTRESLENKSLHPLLIIGVYKAIHPFQAPSRAYHTFESLKHPHELPMPVHFLIDSSY